jgi:hypothetical protein
MQKRSQERLVSYRNDIEFRSRSIKQHLFENSFPTAASMSLQACRGMLAGTSAATANRRRMEEPLIIGQVHRSWKPISCGKVLESLVAFTALPKTSYKTSSSILVFPNFPWSWMFLLAGSHFHELKYGICSLRVTDSRASFCPIRENFE